MNTIEKRILKDVIYRVAHHNKNLWWALKWQIWDSGFQTYYPHQGELEQIAERALIALGTSATSARI